MKIVKQPDDYTKLKRPILVLDYFCPDSPDQDCCGTWCPFCKMTKWTVGQGYNIEIKCRQHTITGSAPCKE